MVEENWGKENGGRKMGEEKWGKKNGYIFNISVDHIKMI